MMRLPLVFATLACAAAPVLAQTAGPIEIGFDASFSHVSLSGEGIDAVSVNIGQFPLQSVRLAVPVTRYVSLEPEVSLLYVGGDGDSQTSFSGDIGALIHLMTDRQKPQVFLRPFVGYDHDAFLSGSSGNRMAFGGGLGVKVPAGGRFAFRAEARYRHGAAVDGVSINTISGLVGLSFFTR
jgi:hypothetical protein